MKIQILGSGCDKCRQLAANAEQAIAMAGVRCDIEKVTDINKITEFGVMMTPALVLDGKVLCVGKVLNADAIAGFIRDAIAAGTPAPTAPAAGSAACGCAAGASAEKESAASAAAPAAAPATGAACGCGCGTGAAAGGACCGGSKKALTVLLLAFVIFSVVAMVVRQSKSDRAVTNKEAPAAATAAEAADTPLTVYYFHGKMRCKTCNSIEALTREAVNTRFADDVAQGRVVFKEVNFDDDANAHFITDFALSSSNVVVQYAGQYRRVVSVWELVRQPDQFGPFIEENVKAMLEVKNEQ